MMLSKDGRCKSFDYSADGFGIGEGVAAIVILPKKECERKNKKVIAYISGSSVNQDGKSATLTAPSKNSQVKCINLALSSMEHIHPSMVTVVEAHGTGTLIGDSIEVSAL